MSESLTEAERAALEALGYTEEWLQSGLLDRRLLADQYERFRAGGTRKGVRVPPGAPPISQSTSGQPAKGPRINFLSTARQS